MTTDTGHLFMCLSAFCTSDTLRCLIKSFAHFLIDLFLLSFDFIIYSKHRHDFYQIHDLQAFFPFCGLSFCSLNSIFGEREALEEEQFINMFFYGLCFWC